MQRHLLLLSLLIVSLWGGIQPSQADTAVERVMAESGRYSLEVPSEWTVGYPKNTYQVNLQPIFYGESMVVGETEAVVQAFLDGRVTGKLVSVTVSPLAFARVLLSSRDETEQELLDGMAVAFSERHFEFEPLELNGYMAGQAHYASPTLAGFNGETVVVSDGLVYWMRYAGEESEAIANTIQIHEPTDEVVRSPFTIDRGVVNLELQPGWLVLEWDGRLDPFASSARTWIGSQPRYTVVIMENYAATLDLLYSNQVEPSNRAVLPGYVTVIGAFPYDGMFGTTEVEVTLQRRGLAYVKITERLNAEFAQASVTELNGAPMHAGELTTVYNRHNKGALMMIDANQQFYGVVVANAAENWDLTHPQVEAVVAGLSANPPATDQVLHGVQLGQLAPDFTGALLDGGSLSLSDLRGKRVLLNFWATWCGPCVEEMPLLQALSEQYDDIVVVGINFIESPDVVAEFVAEHGITYPIVLDGDASINRLFGVEAYPNNFVIDRAGIIRLSPFGETPLAVEDIAAWFEGVD